jgi:hypothetical protein
MLFVLFSCAPWEEGECRATGNKLQLLLPLFWVKGHNKVEKKLGV